MPDTPLRKNYIANVGFWSFNSGMIPITATSDEQARATLMKMLQGHKDIEIFDLYPENEAPKPAEKPKYAPPSFGMDN